MSISILEQWYGFSSIDKIIRFLLGDTTNNIAQVLLLSFGLVWLKKCDTT